MRWVDVSPPGQSEGDRALYSDNGQALRRKGLAVWPEDAGDWHAVNSTGA
jgi:hypothetical protein